MRRRTNDGRPVPCAIRRVVECGDSEVWACVCYSNGKIGHRLRTWGLSFGGEIGRSVRDGRI